jgi:ankyrin repeat protein
VNERDVRGNTAIHSAVALDKKKDYFSVLHVESRSVKLVPLLLPYNPDLNIADINNGQTALMIAIDYQNISAAKVLVRIFFGSIRMYSKIFL